MKSLIVPGDGAPERGQSGVFRVEGEAVRQRFRRRLLNVVRRRQIGFAEVEPQHAVHRHRNLSQLTDAGVRNVFDGMGERGHSVIVPELSNR